MHALIRRSALAAVSAALVVAAATMEPRAAYAAPAPTLTGVVTSGSSDRGDVTVTIFGTRLTTIKTVRLVDILNGGDETITVLSKAADRIVVKVPSDLAAGTYRFVLAPKKGTTTDRDYVVPGVTTTRSNISRIVQDPSQEFSNVTAQVRMRAGDASGMLVEAADGKDLLDVGPTTVTIGGSIVARSPTCRFELASGYAPFGGKELVGVIESSSTNGAEIRFTRTPGTEFFDLGQDGTGKFVIDANGISALTLDTAGNFSIPLGTASKPGGGSWATASDARLKKDVQPLGGALDRLLALRSVSFEYKDPAAIHELPGRQVGFIAQEVEKVFPTWVSERADGMKCVAPKGFESLTVAALRELRDEKDGQIAKLAAENETLRARLADQDARIAAIEKALAGAAAGSVAPAAAQDR